MGGFLLLGVLFMFFCLLLVRRYIFKQHNCCGFSSWLVGSVEPLNLLVLQEWLQISTLRFRQLYYGYNATPDQALLLTLLLAACRGTIHASCLFSS